MKCRLLASAGARLAHRGADAHPHPVPGQLDLPALVPEPVQGHGAATDRGSDGNGTTMPGDESCATTADLSATNAPPKLIRTVLERGFEVAARWRSARAFHPHGLVVDGAVVTGGDHPLLSEILDPRARTAVVRLSRGIGLPVAIPDFHGVGVRIVDGLGPGAPQDLLLVSSGAAPALRHCLRPVRRWSDCTYTRSSRSSTARVC